ncbi:hypothetical protein ACFOY5_02055 [Massilia aurea]|uniref:hypothetical protein n=1 Tax=Massilia aurea TaxID=373040 RepID=UPI0021627A93|nr:hypothetical protein [Massilia aurea]MCS0706980.1 hypothetical protein [Massilia aurea]
MSHDPAFDASIPVLTEVFAEPTAPGTPLAQPAPVVEAETPPPPAPVVAALEDAPEALERRAVDHWSGEQWSVMERRVTERILQQLQGRIDFVLEQRLRDGIAEAVDKAMTSFSADIRNSLGDTLNDVVTRAVSQEIAHIRMLEK